MELNVYIISLKFAPGLKKEFTVIGENLRKYGFNVKYILSQKYSELEYSYDGMNYISMKNEINGLIIDTLKMYSMRKIGKIFSEEPPALVLLYNPHPLNPRLACFIKRNFPDAILSIYLHDPYKSDKTPYGLLKSIYITVVERVQDWTVKYMDHVISPSEYSSRSFKKKYPNFKGQTHTAPLLIPDKKVALGDDRKYFSIVGGIHNATGHDMFIELVNYVAKKNLNYKFCIISSSKLDKILKKLTQKGREILNIINKSIIKDSEIDEVIRQSYAVFRLAKEVTQSGVIPVSYMNATPVIATNIPGHSQHVWHKKTGYLIPSDPDPRTIIQATEYVRDNFDALSKGARKAYEEIWAEWNFDKYYGWILEILGNGKEKDKGEKQEASGVRC